MVSERFGTTSFFGRDFFDGHRFVGGACFAAEGEEQEDEDDVGDVREDVESIVESDCSSQLADGRLYAVDSLGELDTDPIAALLFFTDMCDETGAGFSLDLCDDGAAAGPLL